MEESYSCHLCENVFKKLIILQFHLDVVHDKEGYMCEICGNTQEDPFDPFEVFEDIYSYFCHLLRYHDYSLRPLFALNLFVEQNNIMNDLTCVKH